MTGEYYLLLIGGINSQSSAELVDLDNNEVTCPDPANLTELMVEPVAAMIGGQLLALGGSACLSYNLDQHVWEAKAELVEKKLAEQKVNSGTGGINPLKRSLATPPAGSPSSPG